MSILQLKRLLYWCCFVLLLWAYRLYEKRKREENGFITWLKSNNLGLHVVWRNSTWTVFVSSYFLIMSESSIFGWWAIMGKWWGSDILIFYCVVLNLTDWAIITSFLKWNYKKENERTVLMVPSNINPSSATGGCWFYLLSISGYWL